MLSLAATVLALAATASAGHTFSYVRRHHVSRAQPPAGWATTYLEPYDTYHARYMADDCENKHNTTFFDSCCHPLLATESLAKNRPACCAVGATVACPGAATSSLSPAAPTSSAAAPTSSAAAPKSTGADNQDTDDDDEDCDDEDDNSGDNDSGDNEDNNDDDEDCDDESDESSTPAATSTKVAATHPPAVTTTHADTTVKATPTSSTETTTAKQETTTAKQETTTAKEETTTHTTATSTASTPDKTSSGSLVLGGFGTWFTQGGVAGACGTVHSDSDFVVALETKTYAKGANCGRKIQVIDASNGKSVQGVVADECPTCTNSESVDMSLAMFEKLAALSVGEFSIKWQFLD
ncbi:RlpA-like double-psi beta-barrel-protein domain-containing protein-containing protein [Mycena alexandri]|uniref:RlpA-like double-psi beta-barrel-protein domain-containing protein-containing protein n=1 Tax=Mycena alexandri TaxID=1745969 RepID=A0AAD6TL33_9AGAR|nr:RlpA-like double-psi beta-barrel-protein domain-containing protein-containing protein [Mycena alexandri]